MESKEIKCRMILQMFVSHDKLRQGLLNPFPCGDSYCATNGHSLIFIPKSEMPNTNYSSHSKNPNVLSVYDTSEVKGKYSLSTTDLIAMLGNSFSGFTERKEKCEKCEGNGSVTCLCCGNESDCEECNGTGYSEDIVAYSMPVFDGEEINWLGKDFLPNELFKVMLIATMLGEDVIEVQHGESLRVYFSVGECKLLLMTKFKVI